MPYRTALESRIAKKVTRAIVDFNLIEDGDRVMVGLSGGKDSWTLLQVLDVLRQRAPIRFSVMALTVHPGNEDFRHDVILRTCEERGWECLVQHTSINRTMEEILEPDVTPCSLCARFRRGVIYRIARERGATKIALGHHADDIIETLLLNLFFAGSLKAMPARLVSDNGEHTVIRPLAYVSEAETRAYVRACGLPVVPNCCSSCGNMGMQRQRVKRLLLDLETEHAGVKRSMLRALSNVAPRHLLDQRLTGGCGTAAPER
jgi:tRNA 2-thiocytidine biosynthesis protein TtcA